MTPAEMWYRFNRNLRARVHKKRRNLMQAVERDILIGSLFSSDGIEKDRLLKELRERRVFPWQVLSPEEIRQVFCDRWAQERMATIEAAETICRHEWHIFNQKLHGNGVIDWHYDLIAQKQIPLKHWTDLPYWRSDLTPGVKYIWELNRLQHFVTLAKAYLLTADERYVQELKSQWLDWLAKNPPEYGINWTSPLEAAMRILSFTWALQMAKHSPAFDADFYLQILQSIAHHAEFISQNLSFYSSANNHLLGEALGLVYAGCYYPEFKSAPQWRELGFAILFDQIPKQIYSDGVIKEQTTYYQRYVFDFCLLTKLAADHIASELPPAFVRRMEKMAEFIHALLLEPGDVPHIGDDDGGQTLRLSESKSNPYAVLLAKASCLFHRGDFKAKALQKCEEIWWLLGPTAYQAYQDLAPVHRHSLVQEFREGGYIIFRSHEDALPQRGVFDVGELGLDEMASHGHADALSLVLSVAGEPILLDSGTFSYRGSRKWRNYFRSTHAHNTVVIDGESQSEMVGPFQWGWRAHVKLLSWATNPEGSHAMAQHDGYRHKGVLHTRKVLFDHLQQWSIKDILEGKGKHKIEVLWHFAPGRYELFDEGAIFYYPPLVLKITAKSQATIKTNILMGERHPIQGWYSEEFAVKKPNPVLCISTTANLPVIILTNILIEKSS